MNTQQQPIRPPWPFPVKQQPPTPTNEEMRRALGFGLIQQRKH